MRRLDRSGHKGSANAQVLMAWEKVADGVISAHTTGAHLRDGELVVYVDGNSWATHFTAMSEQLKEALNEAVGEGLVRSIRFTVSKKVAESHRLRSHEEETEEFYSVDDVEPIPLTPLELAQVTASVADIPDEELRQAVLRATVKDIEWKKGVSAKSGRPEAPGSV
jgi:hypothetical protein